MPVENDALLDERVDVRRARLRIPAPPHVVVAPVVGQEEDEVRPVAQRQRQRRKRRQRRRRRRRDRLPSDIALLRQQAGRGDRAMLEMAALKHNSKSSKYALESSYDDLAHEHVLVIVIVVVILIIVKL